MSSTSTWTAAGSATALRDNDIQTYEERDGKSLPAKC